MSDTSIGLKSEYDINLPKLHDFQKQIVESTAKRKIIRAGRRSGKTVVASIIAVQAFLDGKRPLYAAPTTDQLRTFWNESKGILSEVIDAGVFYKNEIEHFIERPGTKNRIKGKTAWNSDMLRGDYCDILIHDEWQLMNEDMWNEVGAPMLLDNNGDAIFIYTPPSLHSRSVSKAKDPRHAQKMFAKALENKGRWEAWHFKSSDNPYISHEALEEIALDMTKLAYRQEILAEDIDEVQGALWTRELINKSRIIDVPDFARIVIGVDPPGGRVEAGIVTAALGVDGKGYVIEDRSLQGSPNTWANAIH